LFLEGEMQANAGAFLKQAIGRVDFVVFYGHGTSTHWNALPSIGAQPAVPLVDLVSVSVLQGKDIYAGCCDSLGPGAPAFFAPAFKAHFQHASFVGYRGQFEFEFANHQEFGAIANASVINYVSGDPAAKVAGDLAIEWDQLRHAFANGRLKNRPNAIMAAHRADNNRQRAGAL
jgi:hypothetical protein